MIDGPYGLDFLQQVTDVHFGSGVWCAIGGVTNLHLAKIEVDFPGLQGGTPGFVLLSSQTVIAGPASKVIASADLNGTVRTVAGQKLTGFTMGRIQIPPVPGPGLGEGVVFLQCTGLLGKKFTVKTLLTYGDSERDAGVEVYLWKTAIKAGVKVQCEGEGPKFSLTAPAPDVYHNNLEAFNTDDATFTIDPVAVTMTVK